MTFALVCESLAMLAIGLRLSSWLVRDLVLIGALQAVVMLGMTVLASIRASERAT